MTGRSRLSRAGLEFIKSFEGFRETASRLTDGRWIVGYGHVRTAREGVTISEADAEALLRHDLRDAEDAVSQSVFAPLNQNQYDALVSLAFNISPAKFRDSSILDAINAGDFLTAAAGFEAWRRARIKGRVVVVDALVRRRAAEKSLFLDPPFGRAAAPSPVLVPENGEAAGKETGQPTIESPTQPPAIAKPSPDAAVDDTEDEVADRKSPGVPDIAEAIRHIAEQVSAATVKATAQAPDIAAEPDASSSDEPTGAVEPNVSLDPVPSELSTSPPVSETLDEARRAMAERVARIIERVEKTMAHAQAVVDQEEAKTAQTSGAPSASEELTPTGSADAQPAAASTRPEDRLRAIFNGRPSPAARPTAQAAAQSVARAAHKPIPEDLPDFDAELRARNDNEARPLIDDTQTFNPGRDPAELFAEGVRAEKVANGHAKRLGPISGRAAIVAPWIAILILSIVGLAIGLVETFRGAAAETAGDSLAGAPTILAVFGVMLVISVYFILTRPLGPK